MSKDNAIYIEFLTVAGWFKTVLPALRLGKCHCYIFDSTALALWLAKQWGRRAGIIVEKLDFQLSDLKDDQGTSIFSRRLYQDPYEVQELVLNSPDFQAFTRGLDPSSRAREYLAKSPVCYYTTDGFRKYTELGHVSLMVQIARWHQRQSDKAGPSFCLYINHRPWMKELGEYARSYGGSLCSLGKIRLRRWQWKEYTDKLKILKARLVVALLRHKVFDLMEKYGLAQRKIFFSTENIRILTEYYGQLNVDDPKCNSDVFYVDGEGISTRDIMLYFNLAVDPIDEKKYKVLKENNLAAVALTPQSSIIDPSLIPIFRFADKVSAGLPDPAPVKNEEARSMQDLLAKYNYSRSYWRQFFKQYNIKIYNSYVDCEATTMATADAMTDVGGVSAIYQRSYEPDFSPQKAVGADILFGFSKKGHEIHLKSRSQFRYYVAVGYLGDHRFEFLRPMAAQVRQRLMAQGATHIIAYFDEGTSSDGRWFDGHQLARDNYSFWLEKLLANPQMGLVLKPKIPYTLRHRLGPAASLLKEAQMTGRCYMFEGGALQGSFPPSAAALVADVAIHECLGTGTAGLEAALAGTRTVLVDLEGWLFSPLHKLGPDVVFRDWTTAWQACEEYFKDPKAHPRFGNWSSMINEFDSFCDGRAAERMSWYLKEILEGLRRKDPAADVMERVAEHYARLWGKDKVQQGPLQEITRR